MRRAERPLDPEAVRAANAAIEPETGGRPLTMGPEDGALRRRWMDAYLAALDEPPPADEAGEAHDPSELVTPCPDLGVLEVYVGRTPYPAPAPGARVTIEGPASQTAAAGPDGIARFAKLPPGSYDVSATYRTGDPLADAAMARIGSTAWSYYAAREPYEPGTNKCNLFVYEMANAAGRPVPRRERWSWSEFGDVWHPPLAREWAGGSDVGGWSTVADPEPGDMIAEAKQYADATGHVGVVGYPEQIESVIAEVPPCGFARVDVTLHRRTVSAGGEDVLYNGWGFRGSQIGGVTFKRHGR